MIHSVHTAHRRPYTSHVSQLHIPPRTPIICPQPQVHTLQTLHAIHTIYHILYPLCSHTTHHHRYAHYKHSTTHTTYCIYYIPHLKIPHRTYLHTTGTRTPHYLQTEHHPHISILYDIAHTYIYTHKSHVFTLHHIHITHISYACILTL